MPFYLGPLGGLQVLPDPLEGLDVSPQWYGGVHRGLGGGATRDRLGRKRSWPLRWDYLSPDQAAFIVAVDQGLVPGPLRLIDMMQKNRCPPQIAAGGSFLRSSTGFSVSGGTLSWAAVASPASAWVAMIPGGQAWTVPATVNSTLKTSTAAADRIPLVPGEQVTASLWVTGSAITARVQLIPYNAAGVAGAAVSGTTTAMTGTYVQRSVTLTPSATQLSCVLALDIPAGQAAGTAAVTALQLELGAAATAWVPGEGCPTVIAESLVESYPYWPWHAVGLNLLEA